MTDAPGHRPGSTCLIVLLVTSALLTGCSDDTPDTTATAGMERPEPEAADPLVEFWAVYRSATAARAAGDNAAAVAGYRRALALDPDHGDSLHFLAQLLYSHGDVDGAAEHLLTLARTEDHSLRSWQQLSVVQGTPAAGWRADLVAAQASIATALGWNPGNSGAHALMARWLAYAGDVAGARAAISEALGHNPVNIEARMLDLWVSGRSGDANETGRAAEAAITALCSGVDGCIAPGRLALAIAGARARIPAVAIADGLLAQLPALSPRNTLTGAPTPYRRAGVLPPGLPAGLVGNWTGAAPAWREASEDGSRWQPWRAVIVAPTTSDDVFVTGGGIDPVRRFRRTGDSWQRSPAPGLPSRLYGGVAAAADFDGDGWTDLMLGNVPRDLAHAPGHNAAPSAATSAILYRGMAGGGFEPEELAIDGVLTAALAFDADDDGDTDLIVARVAAGAEQSAASYLASSAVPMAPSTVLLLRNDNGLLRPEATATPEFGGTVLDFAAIRTGAGLGLYLATGTMLPEGTEPDQLWRRLDSRFVDVSTELGDGRMASTLRVTWDDEAGELQLVRGGLVDGDPGQVLRLPLSR